MDKLSGLKCVACRGGEPALTESQIKELHSQVPEWDLVERKNVKRLKRIFKFHNFAQALAFTNQVGELSETEDHHPAILTEWGRVTVTWWTHIIEGLHKNDFIMAAKTDLIWDSRSNH
jgi:4a-hydroxytetrahydrobiopterin dehydratase